MAVTNRYGLYGVQVETTLLGGMTRQAIRFGSTLRNEPRSGEVYARFQSLVAQKPGATFATEHVGAALDIIPLTGFNLENGVNGLHLYSQKWQSGGSRDTGAVHIRDQIKVGILALRRLSCDHQGDAVLELEAVAGWNGSDVDGPILRTNNISVPTGLTTGERFTLGKITVGGVVLTHFRSLEFDFGLEIVSEGSESEIWDRFVAVRSIQPRMTVRGINLQWFLATGAIPMIGKAGIHANTTVYLRERKAGGTFELDATITHIQITGDGYITIDTPMDASGLEAGECTLMMDFRYDGTNAPLLIDTTAAIP